MRHEVPQRPGGGARRADPRRGLSRERGLCGRAAGADYRCALPDRQRDRLTVPGADSDSPAHPRADRDPDSNAYPYPNPNADSHACPDADSHARADADPNARADADSTPTPTLTPTASPTPEPTETPTDVPGADGAPFTLTGTGTETREIALAEGRWSVTAELSHQRNCLPDPCSLEQFSVQMEHADPGRREPYVLIYHWMLVHERVRSSRERLEVWYLDPTLLRVGRLGAVKSGPQRLVVTVDPSVHWTLTFEEYESFPPPDPAGADGESFALTGTGPARREVRLAEGTWTMIMDISNNTVCDFPCPTLFRLPDPAAAPREIVVRSGVGRERRPWNERCEDPDPCVPRDFQIYLWPLSGVLRAQFIDTASDWTGAHDNLRVADGLEWYYPTGPLVIDIDVAAQAEWTVSFFAPGELPPVPDDAGPGAAGESFALIGTGRERHEVSLAEGRWSLRAEALTRAQCGREPCPKGYLRVRMSAGDPTLQDPIFPIDLEEDAGLRRAGEDFWLMGEEYLWVGRLGDIQTGTQRLVVSAEPTTEWTLTFEDYDGPFPHVDPAGVRGETFALSGIGRARRELILAEGTWTMLIEISNNVLHCDEPDDPCTAHLFLIVLSGTGGDAQLFSKQTRHFSESYELQIGQGLEADHPPGTKHLNLNVAPISEWTVTFVAPGDPIPTPTPAP